MSKSREARTKSGVWCIPEMQAKNIDLASIATPQTTKGCTQNFPAPAAPAVSFCGATRRIFLDNVQVADRVGMGCVCALVFVRIACTHARKHAQNRFVVCRCADNNNQVRSTREARVHVCAFPHACTHTHAHRMWCLARITLRTLWLCVHSVRNNACVCVWARLCRVFEVLSISK